MVAEGLVTPSKRKIRTQDERDAALLENAHMLLEVKARRPEEAGLRFGDVQVLCDAALYLG